MNHPDEMVPWTLECEEARLRFRAEGKVERMDAVATHYNLLAVGIRGITAIFLRAKGIAGESWADRKARPTEIKGTLTVAFVYQLDGGRG